MATKKKSETIVSNVKADKMESSAKKRRVFTLGDPESEREFLAAQEGDKPYKLDYSSIENMYVLIDPSYLGVKEHYVKLLDEEGKLVTTRLVCGVQATNDPVKIQAKYGSSDYCPVCALAKEIFQEMKGQDSDDPVTKKKKDLAKDLFSDMSYQFYAASGKAGISYDKNSKRVITPFFGEGLTVKRLVLTKAAFTAFIDALKKLDPQLPADKIAGVPVNFETGKKEGKTMSEVLGVELFPKKRVDVSAYAKLLDRDEEDVLSFGNIDHVDMVKLQETADKWLEQLPVRMVQEDKPTAKKKAKK